jgi:hypothetical protein
MDKSLILKDIKKHLGLKKDTEFADYLGIKQSNLSLWYKRGTINYDLIISKCKDIDANWLLTGKGQMIKENKNECLKSDTTEFKEDLNTNELELLKRDLETARTILESKNQTIDTQKDLINNLKSEIQRLTTEIELLKDQ